MATDRSVMAFCDSAANMGEYRIHRRGPWRWRVVATAALVGWASVAAAQTCLHGPEESSSQRARREAAIDYVERVNVAQEALRTERGSWGRLDDLSALDWPPVGFVPVLTLDDYNYTIALKDLLDPCGYAIFSDSYTLVYEGSARRQPELATGAASQPPTLDPSAGPAVAR